MFWGAMADDETTLEAGGLSEDSGPQAYVALIEGNAPAVVKLPKGAVVSIGRSHSSAVPVEDHAASRLHATLRWDGGATVRLTDHESRNGTYVGGQRIEAPVDLRSGAEFSVGATRLVVAIRVATAVSSLGPEAAEIVTARDPAMLRVLALAERAAAAEVSVLLVGETGVGKDIVARFIHERSPRREGPFLAINCGAIAETLAESTLFGHERGAFTGAVARQAGYFERAHRGTLFLDEVGELSLAMQIRLLRVLEDRTVVRVGGTEAVPVDVRVIAATNADLEARVRARSFREDLLYRLDVLRIAIPPLRERPDDVVPLAERFLADAAPGAIVRLSTAAADALRAQPWPGNVRELRNVVERSVAVRERDVLGPDDLAGLGSERAAAPAGALRHKVDDVERQAIVEALEACGGNQTRAAKRLGLSRRALIYKLERFGLKPPPSRRD
jgi:transcriptional regulator with PAS, ATPase and Fis domain